MDPRYRLGRDRVDSHRRGAATQLLCAEVFKGVVLVPVEAFERICGDEELALEVSRRLFDARCGIHHVTVVHDRAAAASHFAGDDRAGVQRSAQARHRSELALEVRRGPIERLLIAKKQASGRAPARPSATVQVITTSSPTY